MEHRIRKEKREIAQAKLNELYEAGFESDINDIVKLGKKVVYPRADFVHCVHCRVVAQSSPSAANLLGAIRRRNAMC